MVSCKSLQPILDIVNISPSSSIEILKKTFRLSNKLKKVQNRNFCKKKSLYVLKSFLARLFRREIGPKFWFVYSTEVDKWWKCWYDTEQTLSMLTMLSETLCIGPFTTAVVKSLSSFWTWVSESNLGLGSTMKRFQLPLWKTLSFMRGLWKQDKGHIHFQL